MNSQLKLLLVISGFLITATCFGQRPSCEKPIMHFAADIIRVDSILYTSSHCNRQRTSNIHSPGLPSDKDNIRFELNRGKEDWKVEFICPMTPELDRPKKI